MKSKSNDGKKSDGGKENKKSNGGKESKGSTQDRNEGKEGKQMGFGEEEQLRETGAEGTDEPEMIGILAEVRTGRGSSGLVRGVR